MPKGPPGRLDGDGGRRMRAQQQGVGAVVRPDIPKNEISLRPKDAPEQIDVRSIILATKVILSQPPVVLRRDVDGHSRHGAADGPDSWSRRDR